MLYRMTVSAECLKIVRVERYEGIAYVLRCEMYLVMYYLARLATFNAQPEVTLEHELPKIAPLLRQIELLCELLHNSSDAKVSELYDIGGLGRKSMNKYKFADITLAHYYVH